MKQESYYLGSIFRPLMFGNSHLGLEVAAISIPWGPQYWHIHIDPLGTALFL